MKTKTDSFSAKDINGTIYKVDVWTNMIPYKGRQISGSSEYLLSNGDNLFNVPGCEDQWDIASTNVRITRIEEK